MIYWAAKHARPVDPLERLVLLSGRPHLVTTYTCKTDDFLTSVLVLEALRMLSKTHPPDLDVIAAFQRAMGAILGPSRTFDATGILPLLAACFQCRALVAMNACETIGTSTANRSAAWGLAGTILAPARLTLSPVIIRQWEPRLF